MFFSSLFKVPNIWTTGENAAEEFYVLPLVALEPPHLSVSKLSVSE
jgi:hypothetical protein